MNDSIVRGYKDESGKPLTPSQTLSMLMIAERMGNVNGFEAGKIKNPEREKTAGKIWQRRKNPTQEKADFPAIYAESRLPAGRRPHHGLGSFVSLDSPR